MRSTQVSRREVRVSSRALGPRLHVRCVVYDTLAEMWAAAKAFNGNDVTGSAAVTQAWTDQTGRVRRVTVRLVRDRLGTTVVAHEIHHAATALYGAHLGDRVSRAAHLNHHNEPFAYLFSDLMGGLVQRLYALGYYGDGS